MANDEYSRTIQLRCPTCASTEFASAESEVVTCAGCGMSLSKDELMAANQENIHEHAKEVADEAVADLTNKLGEQLKAAFRGNKYITIK
jgi:ribosomal protein L37AE/L43A